MYEIQTGSYENKPRRIDIHNDILKRIHGEYLPIAEEKKLRFELVSNTKNLFINADPYSMQQVFNHLIDLD